MRKYIAPVVAASLLTMGCAPSKETRVRRRLRAAHTEATRFIGKYGCASTDVTFEEVDDSRLYNRIAGKNAAARTYGNHVLVAASTLKNSDRELFLSSMYHEAVHACSGPKVPLAKPLFIDERHGNIVAARGLNAIWEAKDKDGNDTQFNLVEEAYATLMQEDAHGIPEHPYPPYLATASRLRTEIAAHDISVRELVHYHQTSDFFGLMMRLDGIAGQELPTGDQLLSFMQSYGATFANARGQ